MSAYEEDRELESGIDSVESVTEYLYNGETFDESLSYQYLRARCYCPPSDKFANLDPFAKLDDKDDD